MEHDKGLINKQRIAFLENTEKGNKDGAVTIVLICLQHNVSLILPEDKVSCS